MVFGDANTAQSLNNGFFLARSVKWHKQINSNIKIFTKFMNIAYRAMHSTGNHFELDNQYQSNYIQQYR